MEAVAVEVPVEAGAEFEGAPVGGGGGGLEAGAAGAATTGSATAGTPTSVRPWPSGGLAVKTAWQRVHWTGEPSGERSDSSSS